jgi:hypothetical protein
VRATHAVRAWLREKYDARPAAATP